MKFRERFIFGFFRSSCAYSDSYISTSQRFVEQRFTINRKYLKAFLLSCILLAAAVAHPASYGSSEIVLNLSKRVYSVGESVVISGLVHSSSNVPVVVQVWNPMNEACSLQQTSVENDGSFTTSPIPIVGRTCSVEGTYTVKAFYDGSEGSIGFEVQTSGKDHKGSNLGNSANKSSLISEILKVKRHADSLKKEIQVIKNNASLAIVQQAIDALTNAKRMESEGKHDEAAALLTQAKILVKSATSLIVRKVEADSIRKALSVFEVFAGNLTIQAGNLTSKPGNLTLLSRAKNDALVQIKLGMSDINASKAFLGKGDLAKARENAINAKDHLRTAKNIIKRAEAGYEKPNHAKVSKKSGTGGGKGKSGKEKGTPFLPF